MSFIIKFNRKKIKFGHLLLSKLNYLTVFCSVFQLFFVKKTQLMLSVYPSKKRQFLLCSVLLAFPLFVILILNASRIIIDVHFFSELIIQSCTLELHTEFSTWSTAKKVINYPSHFTSVVGRA